MQQQLPKTIEEAKSMIDTLTDAMLHSLRNGKASSVLEHDTLVELAYELGAVSTMAKLAARVNGPQSLPSLTALILVWRAKYESIHGEE